MRNDILERKDEIISWISKNQSKSFICKQLQCKPETLEGYLSKMGISYSGNKAGKGIKTSNQKLSALEYIKSTHVKSHVLKLKLLEDKIKEHKCEKCSNTVWFNEPIPLELHHVDGNHYNNVLDNLKLLCPTCHAQCDNNSGAARKK